MLEDLDDHESRIAYRQQCHVHHLNQLLCVHTLSVNHVARAQHYEGRNAGMFQVQTGCWRPVIAALRTFHLATFTIVHLGV